MNLLVQTAAEHALAADGPQAHDGPRLKRSVRPVPEKLRMDITTTLPTVDSVLQLEPEELASYLLEHLANNSNHLHLNNLLSTGVGSTLIRHYNNDNRVEEALREAWSWLEREGLLVAKAYGHFISRRGKRIRGRQDFDAYRRSSVLPKASLSSGCRRASMVELHSW